ncbi:isoprenylcysteine carboxyl methyltransferase [Ceratobasidium sp. AG-Ba]|nr:isoprenylcysteine carboxyl methyltransferase [Ceratobasidium sp. AG-Ba]
MYFAGLNIPISGPQALNAASWAATIIWFCSCLPSANYRANVEREAGPVKSMPPGKQGQLVSAVHGLGLFIPMGAFIFSLPFAKFYTPKWLASTSLPAFESRELYIRLRLAGCAGALLGGALGKNLYKHLGSQWAAIGVRERPKLVKTGPYSVVRHPGYALALLQELFFIPMFWNWMFAPGFIIMAIGFAFKMPIEEKVIEDNKEIGDAYKQYKKDVPYRIIPYIW